MSDKIIVSIDLRNVIAIDAAPGENCLYNWTLTSRLGQILALAEQWYGERDKSYTLLGIEFGSRNPHIWYPGGGDGGRKDIIIQLSPECLLEHERGCYQLAHEAVHLLSPLGGKYATNLEEGLAEAFAFSYMASHFRMFWPSMMPSYEAAKSSVQSLLQHRPSIIKDLRQKQPTISLITAREIMEACPELDPVLAEFLGSPFVREQPLTSTSSPTAS